jgi:hypothetical protein
MSEDPATLVGDGPASTSGPVSLSPEQTWEAAAPILYPVLRPAGFHGLRLDTMATPSSGAGTVDPLIDDGPAGLVTAYALAGDGFDVLANGDHFSAWGVTPATLRAAAFGNLAAWASSAPWSDDQDQGRRVLSSDTGEGWDASRILLPDAATYLEHELGGGDCRVLVGLPARHLLLAGCLRADDPEFAPLFANFVVDYWDDSDEAIERGVFELRGGQLSVFEAPTPA